MPGRNNLGFDILNVRGQPQDDLFAPYGPRVGVSMPRVRVSMKPFVVCFVRTGFVLIVL